MDNTLIMGITLGLFVVFLVIELPIGLSLFFAGLIGIFLKGGMVMLWSVGATAFHQMASYSLLAVPLFVLMGDALFHHDVGEEIYTAIYKWVGFLKGGLGIASTWFCAAFGFMCGSTVAANVTIGRIAIPEMEKRHYDRRLALGTLATAGTLASLIPPSSLMILYCMTTGSSIGKLFVAGIIPGLLLACMIATYIYIRATIDPKVAPPGPKFPWKERIPALVNLLPVVLLFLTVIGGMYMGIWTAIEAGAAGALMAFIICAGYRRLSWRGTKAALLSTTKTMGFLAIIIVGANVFVYVFYLTGFQGMIQKLILDLALPGWGIIVLIGIILMILGTFLDCVALMLISAPLFLPIAKSLGFDDIWFGIVMIIFCEMALITPPVGVSLFVIHGIAPKGTTLQDVAIGALPYVGVIWFLFILLAIFPQIALWLPATMK